MLTTHASKKQLSVFDSKVKSYILGIEINFFYSIIFQPVHYQKALIRKAYLFSITQGWCNSEEP